MEMICSSETSIETRRNTRRHIPEDDTLTSTGFNHLLLIQLILTVLAI
jgi:hypothetical protein